MQNFNGTTCRIENSGGARPKVGCIDEVAIYNRSLSASEIASHYNQERMKYEFIISNSSSFAASDLTPNRGVTKMVLNNFSQPQYYDDSYTLLVEHFDSLSAIGWNNGTIYGNFSICQGKFGPGGCFDGDNSYVEVVLPE